MINIGYKIRERFHSGPVYEIFRATKDDDNRPVILKSLRDPYPTLQAINQLRNEYALLERLQSDSVIEVVEMVDFENSVSLVFKEVKGLPLASFTGKEAVPLDMFFTLALQLAEAVKNVHSKRILHRNLSPGNVIIEPTTFHVTLCGFSLAIELARDVHARQSKAALEADLAYISPEQTGRMNSTFDHRADLYSLGCLFYKLLTGVPPFDFSDPMQLVHAHMAISPKPPHVLNSEIPEVLSQLVMKLLAKSPENRYQSATGVLADLQKCRKGSSQLGILPNFPLGEHDVSDQFQIPDKLFGRSQEIEMLKSTFERTESGQAEILFIGGYSGVGKTGLVRELQKIVTHSNNLFISGKFDQFRRDVPFSSLITAFQQLIRQLLTETDEKILHWKQKVLEAVGQSGQVLVDVVPDLSLLIGPQPPVPVLPPVEANNRFSAILNRFMDVFSKSESVRLCLFLDDLQWMDSATRSWIETWLGDQGSKHLLFIGAYRDNEVNASHPMLLMLDRLAQSGTPIKHLILDPLDKDSIGQIVAETLKRPVGQCGDLVEILFQKTGGNPFFSRQCLWSLYEEGAIFFDSVHSQWTYDIEKVKQTKTSDNVLDLMAGIIERLPKGVQNFLTTAACIGNQFDLETIRLVNAQSMQTTSKHLSIALQQGLVVQQSSWIENKEGAYFFVHDRIQQAALSLLSESEKQQISLKIGRFLLQSAQAAQKLYEIVNHFNYAILLLDDPEEKQQVVALNLRVSTLAKNSSAFEPALVYCKQAMELLPTTSWDTPSPLTQALLLQRAECEHLGGHNQEAEHYFDQAIRHASTPMNRAEVYLSKINYFTNLGKFELAYQTGRQAVGQLGVQLPATFSPPVFVKDLVVNGFLMRNQPISGIVEAKEMTDERLKMAVRIMASFARAAYQIKPVLCIAVSTRIVNMCMRHGNTAGGSTGFLAYGAIFLGAIIKKKQTGFDFGQLTLALVDKYNDLSFKAEAYFVVGYFAMPWRRPAKEMEDYWHIAYETGLETGDLFHASCACCGLIQSYYMRGMAFSEILAFIDRYQIFLARINNKEALNTLLAVRQSVLNLRGETESPTSYDTESFDEKEYLQELAGFGTRHFAHYYFINKMQTLYLWGKYEEAYSVSVQSDKYLPDSPGMLHTAEHYFYKGLILCSLYSKSDAIKQARWRLKLNKIRANFEKFALGSPSNFQHKGQVLTGQICQITGDVVGAERYYGAAIASAKKYGYIHIQALAGELLGRLHLEAGRSREAAFHIRNAEYLYSRLGADAYANEFQLRYSTLNELPEEKPNTAAVKDNSASWNPVQMEEDTLDLISILKASEAISREIRLPDLLSAFMKIITENAGGQRMVFISQQGQESVIQAEYSADTGEVKILDDLPLDTYDGLAKSVISYAIRTRKPLILEQADTGDFETDPYILSQTPRSILCMPLLQLSKIVGIFYLENNLVYSAFSPERIQLLNLLSGQMAISIENALFYKNLEAKVDERTAELHQSMEELKSTQAQLIQREKMASLGELAAGIAHEIQNPLNFVNNFSEINVELISELKEELASGDPDEAAAILDDLSTNLAKVHSYGIRASGIVSSMLHHSRSSTSGWQKTDLNKLADEYLHLSYQGFFARDMAFYATLQTNFDETIGLVNVSPQDIGRVFQNLFNNAFYAVSEKKLHPTLANEEYQPTVIVSSRRLEGQIEFLIWDNGTGIDEPIIKKIFQPFFTTKPTGKGTGLGLSVCYDVVIKGHDGTLSVESQKGIFTQIRFTLPVVIAIS